MAGWKDLTRELDAWQAAGRTATFWWRDDDASAQTPALDRLLTLRSEMGVPLALAVVPETLDAALCEDIDSAPGISICQHGYTHRNFAGPGERKIELDGSRPADYVVADLAVGMSKLSGLANWAPVLVPPWNRIAPHLLPFLPELGYAGLSTFGPRARAQPLRGLVQANTHIDIIDWRGRHGGAPGQLAGEAALAAAINHLSARRSGAADENEPTGLMTHHLVHDEAAWDFVQEFIATVQSHPAARWLDAPAIFRAAQ